MLLENDIEKLSDITGLVEDESEIDDFIETLNTPPNFQSQFKTAILTLFGADSKECDDIDDSDEDDCYQEAFINPSNKQRLKAVWNCDNAKTDFIHCIGSLRIEFVDDKLTNREFCHGTGTVINIDKNNCCQILTAAHNGYQLLRECPQCKKKTICIYCKECERSCKRVKPFELIQAKSITFYRRCIVRKQTDLNTGEERIFGDPISSYHVNNYMIYKSLYEQYATAKSGYDICIMTFQCDDDDDAAMYRKICGNIKLICDPTFGSKVNARLHIFGYPGSKGYIEKDSNQMMYQMYGMSTGINFDKMKVGIHDITKKKYIINGEIDTQPGMSGSAIWTIHGKRCKEFFIYGVHTGGKQEADCGENYGTFLDESHIEWIKNIQFKLLLKNGLNYAPSKKREYIIPQLEEKEYTFRGGKGYNNENVLIKTTTRRLHDDEKEIEIKEETRLPEKLFADENHKIILVCGKTGAGKTTLINSMMNYVYNIKQDDKCRMKLIEEIKKSDGDAGSQTDHIVSYTIEKPNGGNIKYDLTIIDTPGFGDCRGIEKDMQTVEEYKYIFEKIIANINGICFIVKSSDNRLDATQTYVFNNMLNLWGKDVAQNIFILMTFADIGTPNCIDALDKIDVLKQCNLRFKMNNSAFEIEEYDDSNEFNELFWQMGMKCFANFFDKLNEMEPKPMKQSIEVLIKREEIRTKLHHFMEEFKFKLNKQNEIAEIQKYIESQKEKINSGVELTWEEEIIYYEEQKIDKWNKYALSCRKHERTCHQCYGRGFFNTLFRMIGGKSNCIMVEKDSCKICGCHYSEHVENMEYVKKTKLIQRSTVEYDQDAKEELPKTQQILQKFEKQKENNIDKICKISSRIQTLRKELANVALRPQVTTFGKYIDELIEIEEDENKKKMLEDLKKKEKLIMELQDKKDASSYVLFYYAF